MSTPLDPYTIPVPTPLRPARPMNPAASMTASQLWAWMLGAIPRDRLLELDRLLADAQRGQRCDGMDHERRIADLRAMALLPGAQPPPPRPDTGDSNAT